MSVVPTYIYSNRHVQPSPARGCIVEFEDVFADLTGATVLAPTTTDQGLELLKSVAKAPSRLFMAVLEIYEALNPVRIMKETYSHNNSVYAYVFDAFLDRTREAKPSPFKSMSRSRRTLRKIDHLFVPFRESVADFKNTFQIPVSYVPLAADVLKFGDCSDQRPIDVNAYGRQYVPHVHTLVS